VLAQLFGKEFARRRALKRAEPGPLRDFLATPFPSKDLACRATPIVALDLETTGLDPKRDNILSIGLVDVRELAVRLDTAWHQVVQIEHPLREDSVIIHEITDDAAAAGRPLDEVLPRLLEKMAGCVMLVHYKNIEQNFLDAACRRLYGAPFVIPTIDTLALALRVYQRTNYTVQTGDLRLFNLRPRYNLPRYKAHNALSDALATAELFLAMAAEMAPGGDCRIGRFLD
jgi:DNA polymerase-3 subunit epsilon